MGERERVSGTACRLAGAPEAPAGATAASGGAPAVPAAAVELDHVTFGYGDRAVLHDVSVRFPHGMVSVLVGPNGCGKSTLVRCVASRRALASGRVTIDGVDATRLDGRARARLVAVMPQGAQPPDMEVERLVAGGRYPYRGAFAGLTDEDRAIMRDAMGQAGCLAMAHRNVRDLSGGERQRAYLALVLAQRTGTVILDEPTAYLDPGACFDLASVVAQLKAAGTTVIMVLHDLPLALTCADRVAVMRAGRIEAFGSPQDVAATGVIDDVFGVQLRRVEVGEGPGEGAGEETGGEFAWCLLPAAGSGPLAP